MRKNTTVRMLLDNKMTASGTVRKFQTPPVPADGHYVCALKCDIGK